MGDKQRHLLLIQRNSEELANNYPSWFRKVEWLGIIAFFSFLLLLGGKTIVNFYVLWPLILPAFMSAWVIADFACGVVHWLADTWGSVDIPILGAALIRPFREHHVDPEAITRHDFIETNAASAIAGFPILIICSFIPITNEGYLYCFLFLTLFFLTIFVLFTNQIHKWSHSRQNPYLVKFLQKRNLILNPIHHQIHHTAPFNKHYCITSGWLNHFLYSINFFSYCEKIITKYTGALPRRDDIGETAAREVSKINGKAS